MQPSPQVAARIGGVLYLIIVAIGLFSEMFVRGQLIVSGDAAATAANIAANEGLWRWGIAADIFMHVCDVPLAIVFYLLLKPVNKTIALLALLFTMLQSAVMVAFKISLVLALFLVENAGSLRALTPAQRHAMMYLCVRADAQGFGIGLIFFGFACLALGYLILKSTYLPAPLGVLMQLAGASYLINSFALLLAPRVASALFPAILAPAFIGELSLCLWLLVKGVDVGRWGEVARGV